MNWTFLPLFNARGFDAGRIRAPWTRNRQNWIVPYGEVRSAYHEVDVPLVLVLPAFPAPEFFGFFDHGQIATYIHNG